MGAVQGPRERRVPGRAGLSFSVSQRTLDRFDSLILHVGQLRLRKAAPLVPLPPPDPPPGLTRFLRVGAPEKPASHGFESFPIGTQHLWYAESLSQQTHTICREPRSAALPRWGEVPKAPFPHPC